jgi:hypothetical protein
MAIDTTKGHPAMDYKEHVRTYAGFVRATVMGIVFVGLILVGMLIGLT